MLLKPFGSYVYLDETEGDGEDNGGAVDRGDDFEASEDEEIESEASGSDEEVESESEEKQEEKEEKKEEKKAEEKKPAKMVPHARMKEAVEKERKAREATEKKLEEAEQKVKESQRGVDMDKLNTEIEDIEEKLDKAIADNDQATKKALRKELREKQMTLARAEAAALSAQATAMAVERVRYDALVERLEAQHPEMNPEHESYDEDMVAEIVDLKSAYEAKGESSSEALRKAVKYVFKNTPEKKAESKDEEESTEEAEAEVEKRREEAVRKAEAIKKKQPPVADKGKSSDKSGGGMAQKIGQLSDEEFDKLDPKQLARLRGDTVA